MTTEPQTIETRVSRLEGAQNHAATKADLAELHAATKADLAELRVDLKGDVAEVRGSVAALNAEMRMLKWGMGMLCVLNIAVLTALLQLLVR